MMLDSQSTQEGIRCAVQLACRAPSIHNSQPWQWEICDTTLHLYARYETALQVVDPARREMYLGLGAVLWHVEMVMKGFGWLTDTTILPDPKHVEHVAEVAFRRATSVTEAQRRRIGAIAQRRTDRLPMAPPLNWERFSRNLTAIVGRSGTILDRLPDDSRRALTQASDFAEAARAYDSPYRAELTWWSHRGPHSPDGIPDSALITATDYRRVGLAREFPSVNRPQWQQESRRADAAKVVVLSTVSDNIRDVVLCGQALAAVLIEATCAGFATCTVSHVTENPQSRAMIGALTSTSALPQVLVRIGISSEKVHPTPTPRRQRGDVVKVVSPSWNHDVHS